MATDIKEQYLEAAGWATNALKMAGSPEEMQIALSMVCSNFCIQLEIHPDLLRDALVKNMKSISEDRQLMLKMVEYISNVEAEVKNNPSSPIILQ